jgi:hypothetical protein
VELRAVLDPQAAHRHVVAQEESYELQIPHDFHEQVVKDFDKNTTGSEEIQVAGRRALPQGCRMVRAASIRLDPGHGTDTDPNVTHVSSG